MLLTGKGNARTLECWLRDHQACNPDWSHLVLTSLKFTVPSGHRRLRSTHTSALHTRTCAVIHVGLAEARPGKTKVIGRSSLTHPPVCIKCRPDLPVSRNVHLPASCPLCYESSSYHHSSAPTTSSLSLSKHTPCPKLIK